MNQLIICTAFSMGMLMLFPAHICILIGVAMVVISNGFGE
jgi:hypothetical protein